MSEWVPTAGELFTAKCIVNTVQGAGGSFLLASRNAAGIVFRAVASDPKHVAVLPAWPTAEVAGVLRPQLLLADDFEFYPVSPEVAKALLE